MLWQLTALEAAAQIREGLITSEALINACLERIEETEPTLKAWVHLDREQARSQAVTADRLRQAGKSSGICPRHIRVNAGN